MRPLLAPSLLNVVVDNLRKGNAEGRLFEMSNIYIPKQLPVTELPEERLHLGFAAWGMRTSSQSRVLSRASALRSASTDRRARDGRCLAAPRYCRLYPVQG